MLEMIYAIEVLFFRDGISRKKEGKIKLLRLKFEHRGAVE